jgi:hypothetical protein
LSTQSGADSPKINAFIETAALYAIMTGDKLRAKELAESMSGGERREFADQLSRLLFLVEPITHEPTPTVREFLEQLGA